MSKKELGVPYASFARMAAEETSGGRWGAISRTVYVGSDDCPAYPAPAAAFATQLPDEPSLGYPIDQQPAVGEAHEIGELQAAYLNLPTHDQHRAGVDRAPGDVASSSPSEPSNPNDGSPNQPLVERLNSSRSAQLPDAQSASGPFKRRV